ncbi:MAG: kelch repeat-containing protein [Chloroflexota bacterium]
MKRMTGAQGAWLAAIVFLLFTVGQSGKGEASAAPGEWRWALTGSLNEARSGHTATLLSDGRVLVAGGLAPSAITASAEAFDPVAGVWSVVGSMAAPRVGHTATRLADGRVLVAGGRDDHDEVLDSAELFDPATGTWSAAGRMGSARAGHAAVLLNDGDVLISGGFDEDETKSYSVRYHPATGAWTWAGAMNKGRAYHTATVLLDGRVLVVGGYLPGNVAELFDPATDTWRYAGGRGVGFPDWHAATRLDDGRVLVTGENVTARYDPASESWTGEPKWWNMAHHAAALMGDGRVLICGGYDNSVNFPYDSGYLDFASIFDPQTDEWGYSPSMTQPRVDHTATRLLDGRVLVVGGYRDGSLASAELYAPFLLPFAVYAPVLVQAGE